MSAEIKTEFKIPDLWYDVYARLLPGTAFAVAVRFFLFDRKELPTLSEFAVLGLAGYFAALLTQPMASRVVGWIEDWVEKRRTGERLFVRKLQQQLGSSSRRAMILSKMHGEVTFFVQLGLLSLVFLALNGLRVSGYAPDPSWAFLVFIIAAGAAVEVAFRRVKRARNELAILAETPPPPTRSAVPSASTTTTTTTTRATAEKVQA